MDAKTPMVESEPVDVLFAYLGNAAKTTKLSYWQRVERIEGLLARIRDNRRSVDEKVASGNIGWKVIDANDRNLVRNGHLVSRCSFPGCQTTTHLQLGEGIVELDSGALSEMPCLRELRLPSTLRKLNREFAGYDMGATGSLEVVEFGDGPEEIGDSAFCKMGRLKKVRFPLTLKRIGGGAFECCESLERVELPAGTETVGDCAFEGCVALKEVVFPHTMKKLGWSSFCGCRSLERIEIPGSVKLIPTDCFQYCEGIKELVLHPGVEVIAESSFEMADSDRKDKGCGARSLVLPEGLKKIWKDAFRGWNDLSEVVLPESLEYLNGFSECAALKSINLPKGLRLIGKGAFAGCANLEIPTIPESIRGIGERAFYGTKWNGVVRLPATCAVPLNVYDYRSTDDVVVVEGVNAFTAPDRMERYNGTLLLPSTLKDISFRANDVSPYEVSEQKRNPDHQLWKDIFWGVEPTSVRGRKRLIGEQDRKLYPAGHRVFREIFKLAGVLSNHKGDVGVRVKAFRRLFQDDCMFPCFSLEDKGAVAGCLTDHPSARQWWCRNRLEGYEPFRAVDGNLFEQLRHFNPNTKEEKELWQSLQTDNASSLLISLDLLGEQFPKLWFMQALRDGRVGVLSGLYRNKFERVNGWLSLKGLLFYAAAHYRITKALAVFRMVEGLESGLVRAAVDWRGCNALWYTLYRDKDAGDSGKIVSELIRLGCDPDLKNNHLGLSWNDVAEDVAKE